MPTAVDVRSVPGIGVSGTVDGREVEVGRRGARAPRRRLGDAGRPSGTPGARRWWWSSGTAIVVGAIAVATPLRPEAAASRRATCATGPPVVHPERGQRPGGASTWRRQLGITDARSDAEPGRQARCADRHARAAADRVLMVGDGVNDAPALAAADVGCAIGSGSEAALANSDVALLGNDLQGVPAAVGVARSTYAVIVQNFGWAMGYNVSALPLAAFGLLDPLVAAMAMGLSSILVVLNSLRLTRLGRSGLTGVHASLHGGPAGRGRVGPPSRSSCSPVSPWSARSSRRPGASPSSPSCLPSATRTAPWWSVGDLPGPRAPGLNQFHLIFSGSEADLATVKPLVVASIAGGAPQNLRQLRVGAGHFTDFVLLQPGRSTFHVTATFGGTPVSFDFSRTLS